MQKPSMPSLLIMHQLRPWYSLNRTSWGTAPKRGYPMSIENVICKLHEVDSKCTRCNTCLPRCEVLDQQAKKCVGEIAAKYLEIGGSDPSQFAANISTGQRELMRLTYAALKCCLCGYCTANCSKALDARELFTSIRELLVHSGFSNGTGFESLQMDRQWNLFSAYRAIYGYYYTDLSQLGVDASISSSTLFFPGCTLVSYAPKLTREIYAKICEIIGEDCLITEECCGSPLVSAGYLDRAIELRRTLMQMAVDKGIKRVICVCPGCMEALESIEGISDELEFVPLPQLLLDAGETISPKRAANAGKLAIFDSCHDRKGRFGQPLRQMMAGCNTCELEHNGQQTLCCGAGGSCSLVDPDIVAARTQRILDEGSDAGAQTVVCNCPTCSYTLYSHTMQHPDITAGKPQQLNYTDLLFDNTYNWDAIFQQLSGMWSGEYGAWAAEVLSCSLDSDTEPREFC